MNLFPSGNLLNFDVTVFFEKVVRNMNEFFEFVLSEYEGFVLSENERNF